MIRPTGNRVILKKDEDQLVSKGGLILTAPVTKQTTAVVIAVGPGKCSDLGVRIPIEVCEGDRVVYNQHGGQVIRFDDQEYHIFYDHDIYAVIETN
jgi:chaperonin GroES